VKKYLKEFAQTVADPKLFMQSHDAYQLKRNGIEMKKSERKETNPGTTAQQGQQWQFRPVSPGFFLREGWEHRLPLNANNTFHAECEHYMQQLQQEQAHAQSLMRTHPLPPGVTEHSYEAIMNATAQPGVYRRENAQPKLPERSLK